MSQKKKLISDKISDLLNTVPGVIDPEDDIYQETTAKIVSKDTFDSDASDSELKSKFRKQNLELLENFDQRYAGTRSSRKDFDESLSEEDEKDSIDGQSSESEIDSEDENDSIDQKYNQELVDHDSSVESDTDKEETDDKISSFKNLKAVNVNSQVQKGNSVKKQLLLWENLLEIRIKLQKCLVNANKLPQREAYQKIRRKCPTEFDSKVSQTRKNVRNVLNNLLNLQDMLLKSYPETQSLGQKDTEISKKDDEEIPSDTEDEDEHTEGKSKDEPPSKKCKTFDDFENVISQRHNDYQSYRNGVIKKWNDKTRLSTAKDLGKNTNSIVNQIEFILKDREKSIKRTQLKRSNYQIIGAQETKINVNDEKQIDETSDKPHRAPEEYNSEIYDDDDFYHQLLRELIEYKSSDITDPVKLSRQWIQLQSMRNKMKRKIDTRATKGRKIRYTIHTKLVNFMAPIPDNKWTDAAKNELYNSLFGSKMLLQNKE